MTQLWEPGTSYNYGDVVEFEGHRYKIIQPHRSQGDWTPSVTPALWGRTQDGGHHGHQGNQNQQYQQQPQHNQGGYQQPISQPQKEYQPSENDMSQNEEKKQEKKHWYEDKKTMGIAGGLLAGAAAIGVGALAYNQHEKHKDERKNQAWAHSTWLEDAEARTQNYFSSGKNSVGWVLADGKNIPRNAIQIGEDSRHGWRMYSCRAFHKGGIAMGKASDVFQKGGVLGHCNDEIHVDRYEILVGDMSQLRWVQWHGRLNVGGLQARPVEGGREDDGTSLYIARAHHKDAMTPGKCSEKLDGAYIPYDGGEECISDYQVLCYAH